jgi:membrane protease YdiL (CAAX protease family)
MMTNWNDPATESPVNIEPSEGTPLPEAYSDGLPRRYEPVVVAQPGPAVSARVKEIPSLSDTFLFFALAFFILLIGELLTVAIGRNLPPFRHEDLNSLASDPRLMIPAQALQYGVLLGFAALIFGAMWHQPFWKAIHWNTTAITKRWIWLAGLGVLLGLGNGLASNYLPMPKEAPILNDLLNSTSGAWLMFIFGSTGAPLIEELAFRGFLLPSLVNIFRGLERRQRISPSTTLFIGIPVSILLTSLPFALLHSLQVSNAWAPILLIGIVSVVLCLVRLRLNSLAASTLVHAAYNFSLFAGMLIASDGFRHLEKLNS